MKGRAFLFGLNYKSDPNCTLNGCINDVVNMASYLESEAKIPCEIYTDEANPNETSAQGMLNKLQDIAMQSHRDELDFVWIHYSGHGSYVRDGNTDEKDGKDECLVPHDFKTAGMIPDDYIVKIFATFRPKTRVVCVFDCCHSATIGDVKYSWEGPWKVVVENIMCSVPARIITLSGCLDDQTSADAYNVLQNSQFIGAMTACLLLTLRENKQGTWSNVFTLLTEVRKKLIENGFSQKPKLCSSYNLARDRVFIPAV